jgi:hypothetical protein
MPLRKSSTPVYHLALALRQISTALTKLRAAEGVTDMYYELVRHQASIVAFKNRLAKGTAHVSR